MDEIICTCPTCQEQVSPKWDAHACKWIMPCCGTMHDDDNRLDFNRDEQMLTIGPMELIALISEGDARVLAQYTIGETSYEAANEIAKTHDFKLNSFSHEVRERNRVKKQLLTHYTGFPCGSKSFYRQETDDKTKITCTRCIRMVLHGKAYTGRTS